MRTIVKASQSFEGPAWVAYDSQFRRKASILKTWDWGSVDSQLYNECFTGGARAQSICQHCFSSDHPEQQCPLTAPTLWPTTTPAAMCNSASTNAKGQGRAMVELCGLSPHRKRSQIWQLQVRPHLLSVPTGSAPSIFVCQAEKDNPERPTCSSWLWKDVTLCSKV